MYMEKKDSANVSQFSIVDAKEWNDDVKQRSKQKSTTGTKDDVINKDCTDPDPKQHKQ
jgi:hypothetical protein